MSLRKAAQEEGVSRHYLFRQGAQESRPWTPQELCACAHEISGKTIGKKWHTKCEKCHREILKARPAKLDPKRAQNFSKASIGDFYEKHEGTHFCFDGMCASLLLAVYL